MDVFPPKLSIRQSDPRGNGNSIAAIVKPLMAVTCPATPKGKAASMASSWAEKRDIWLG